MPTIEQRLVLVATGRDQPGILDEVTKYLLEHGATIHEVATTNLRGQVALLMLVGGDRPTLASAEQNLPFLQQRLGMTLAFHPAVDQPELPGHRYRLRLRGEDETGTLRKVSHLLGALGINIEQVASQQVNRGFEMTLGFIVPREMPITNLREYFDQLLSPLKVRWDLAAT